MIDSYGNYTDGTYPENYEDMKIAIDADPFVMLTGLCRVLGFHYNVRQTDYGWNATIKIKYWPADFYGLNANGERSYGCIGAKTRLDALKIAFEMAVGSIRDNCNQWRRIAMDSAPYLKKWNAVEIPDIPITTEKL